MAASTSTSVGAGSSVGLRLDQAMLLQGVVNISRDNDNAEPIPQAPTKNSKKRTLDTENVAHGNKKKKEQENCWPCRICGHTYSTTGNLIRHDKDTQADKFEQGFETASNKTSKRGKGNRRAGEETKCVNTKETKLKEHFFKRHGTEDSEDRPCASSISRGHLIFYSCQHCNTFAINLDSAVKHAELHKQPNFEPITSFCDDCGASYDRQYFDNHSSYHAYDGCNRCKEFSLVWRFDPDQILDKNLRDRLVVSLKTYAKQIKSSSIYQHTRKVKMNSNKSSGRPLYRCSRCHVCVRPEEVEDHCDLDGTCEETPPPQFFCDQCNEIFCTPDMMEEHKKEHERYGADGFRTITFNSEEDALIYRQLKLRNENQDLDISTCTHVLLKKPDWQNYTSYFCYAGPYRVLKRTKNTVSVDVIDGVVTVETNIDGIVVPISPKYITPCDAPRKTRSNRICKRMSIYEYYKLVEDNLL